jgi:tripartite-type tricarboxylate transporter receptor subunit TctC
VPVGSTPEEFAKFIADDMAKSAKIIDEAKIKTD